MSRLPSLEDIEQRFLAREQRQRENQPGNPVTPTEPEAAPEHTPKETTPHTQDTTGVDEAPPPSETQRSDSDPQATIAELREQLRAEQHARATIQGRLAPTQQDLANMRLVLEQREAEAAEKDARLAEMEARLATTSQQEANNRVREAILSELSEEERDAYDDQFLDLVGRLATVAARNIQQPVDVKAEVASALRQQEDERLQDYRGQVITEPGTRLSQLREISNDPTFIAWLDERPELNFHLTGMVNARTRRDINKFAKASERHLQDYFDHIAKGEQSPTPPPSRSADPTPSNASLERAMDRRQSGPRTQEEENKIIAQINELSRSRNPADREQARHLIDKLDNL